MWRLSRDERNERIQRAVARAESDILEMTLAIDAVGVAIHQQAEVFDELGDTLIALERSMLADLSPAEREFYDQCRAAGQYPLDILDEIDRCRPAASVTAG